MRRRSSSHASELHDALQQQTATSEVLRVISRAPFDLQTVLDTLMQLAARLCEAEIANIWRPKDGVYRMAASSQSKEYLEKKEYLETVAIEPNRRTVTGRALLDGKTVHVHDVQGSDYNPNAVVVLGGYRTVLSVPLLSQGVPIGAIALTRSAVRPFTKKQIELVETFADQAVIAIENVRLLDELRQRTDDLAESLEQQTATSEVLQVISSSPGDLEPVFNAILQNAARICGAQNATLWIYENGQVWRAARLSGVVDATVPPQPSAKSVLMRAIQTKQILHIEDYRNDQVYRDGDPFATAVVDQLGIRTYAAVPMLKEGEPIGAIAIYRTEVKPFSEKQIQLIR